MAQWKYKVNIQQFLNDGTTWVDIQEASRGVYHTVKNSSWYRDGMADKFVDDGVSSFEFEGVVDTLS